jgi:hypothetical protein
MTELFVVAENGQVEVNWESLELLTSAEFVEVIKEQLSDWSDFGQCPSKRLFSIEVIAHWVAVVLVDWQGAFVLIYDFDKRDNSFHRSQMSAPNITLASKALEWVRQ